MERSPENEAMQHCVDILTGGYVQSFVDFFYLTNRDAPGDSALKHGSSIPERPPQEKEEKCVEQEDGAVPLAFISEKLTEAEKARRAGDPSAVVANYEALASAFSENGQPESSLHFFRKCLKLAQLVDDVASEMRATFQLGLALSKIPTETENAIEYLERNLQLAGESKNQEAASEALRELSVVYDRRAAELDSDDVERSIVYLEKLLKTASDLQDMALKATANFRIGKAFNRVRKPDRAIVALTQSLDFARQNDDIKTQGETCAALADAYLQVEDKLPKAIEYLQETRRIASQNGDTVVQSSACRELGYVFTKSADTDQSVNFYEQNFDLVRTHQNIREEDRARVLLGVALKNKRRRDLHKSVVANNIARLLDWKVARKFDK